MVKRSKRPEQVRPASGRAGVPAPAPGALERHSGEGSASVLETLQKLESGRQRMSEREQPADRSPPDEPEL